MLGSESFNSVLADNKPAFDRAVADVAWERHTAGGLIDVSHTNLFFGVIGHKDFTSRNGARGQIR